MDAKRNSRSAAVMNAGISAHIGDKCRLESARLQESIAAMNKTKIILRLPDGRIITVTRQLPRLPLGV
jgi:hypothetical protein